MSFCKHFKNLEQAPFSHSTPLDFLLQMGGYLISYDFSFLNPSPFSFLNLSFFFHSHAVLIETYCYGLRLSGGFFLFIPCSVLRLVLLIVYFFTTLFREKKAFFHFVPILFFLFFQIFFYNAGV